MVIFVHGYPPHFKGSKERKVNAAVSLNLADSKTDSAPISVAQYNQLMELLNKQSISDCNKSQNSFSQQPDHAIVAGKVCLLA